MSSPAFLQGFLSSERGIFAKVLGAVPESGLDYRPDPIPRSAGDLIGHLMGHNLDLIELVDEGTIHHRNQVSFESLAAAVAEFDESFGVLIDKLGSLDQNAWMETGKFFADGHLIMEAPRQQLAWMFLLDSVHHRGQLSTYLRPMGSKVPAIYGPSADDQGEGH
jgi:uncharacterized damage-inducible protein DinB